MKKIMMAALAGLMLSPAAFAAVPMAAKSKPALNGQTTQDVPVLLAAGRNRTGTISIPRGSGFVPGKSFFG